MRRRPFSAVTIPRWRRSSMPSSAASLRSWGGMSGPPGRRANASKTSAAAAFASGSRIPSGRPPPDHRRHQRHRQHRHDLADPLHQLVGKPTHLREAGFAVRPARVEPARRQPFAERDRRADTEGGVAERAPAPPEPQPDLAPHEAEARPQGSEGGGAPALRLQDLEALVLEHPVVVHRRRNEGDITGAFGIEGADDIVEEAEARVSERSRPPKSAPR